MENNHETTNTILHLKDNIDIDGDSAFGQNNHLSDEAIRNFLHYIGTKHVEFELQDGAISLDNMQCDTHGYENIEPGNLSPLGRLIVTKKEKIVEANFGVANILGLDHSKLIGSQFWHFVSKESKATYNSFILNIHKNQTIETCDIILVSASGALLHAHLTGSVLRAKDQYLINLIDTTELARNYSTLCLYRNMLHNISEGIFLIRTTDQVIVYVNPALEQLLGYQSNELVGERISTINAPTNKSPEQIAKGITRILRKTGTWQGEIKNVKKDGTTLWCYAKVSTFNDPQFGNVWVSVHTDITERKLAQEVLLQSKRNLQVEVAQRTQRLDKLNEKLKLELNKRKTSQEQLKLTFQNLRNLNIYLQRVREEEQINIARIIHDDIAQLLTTLKIELSLLKEKNSIVEIEGLNPIDSMLHLTDACLKSVTSVITELRPVILDKMGLIPALKQLFINFQTRTGIVCDILIAQKSLWIKDEMATSIYRVVQEALTNIRNHSKATHVSIKIAGDISTFSIIMKDNGRGITPEEVADPGSFGIIGMKERILGIQGTITFKGIQGKGTTVKLKVPVAP